MRTLVKILVYALLFTVILFSALVIKTQTKPARPITVNRMPLCFFMDKPLLTTEQKHELVNWGHTEINIYGEKRIIEVTDLPEGFFVWHE